MRVESLIQDARYALRGVRRDPLFAANVAATIGLGLGVLCSAFTIVNAYLIRPIDVPDPHSLVAVMWDTDSTRNHRFTLADVDDLRISSPHLSRVIAAEEASIRQDGISVMGLLVSGNYFEVLGAPVAMGRGLLPADASSPGAGAVAVLSNNAWRTRFGADPAIVGKVVDMGRTRLEVVGVAPPGFGLAGDENVSFWAPLTMARSFDAADPWSGQPMPSLFVVGRLKPGSSGTQLRDWLDGWLRQRFAGTSSIPTAVRVESRATRVPLNGRTRTLFVLVTAAFSLVLLVACANVTNLMLARALKRQREIAVRLTLGASRWRIATQLVIESLVLAVPAAAVGLALTTVTARVFPALIIATFPPFIAPVQSILIPLDPDVRVIALLSAAAIVSAVLVSLVPALRVTRTNLVHASKGDAAMDVRRSRLQSALVAVQIGACALFLVGAASFIAASTRMVSADTRLDYERVVNVWINQRLRPAVATRLAADPAVERVAVAWWSPLISAARQLDIVVSSTRQAQPAGFMVVSPEYFPMFGVRVVSGRVFTKAEADEDAAVVLVSEATARALWPGRDPIGQTIEVLPSRGRTPRQPAHTSVRVIGVTEDVVSGTLLDGLDPTCVYFAARLDTPGELSLLIRGRGQLPATKSAITAAVSAIDPDAAFQSFSLPEGMGVIAWIFKAFSVTTSLIGAIGLVLAFSGTYAVVAFVITQRTREIGIRLAIGATVRQIVVSMLKDTGRTGAIGIIAGLAIAGAAVRLFRGQVPIIPAFAVAPYATGASIVLAATMLAALLPSLRAARIDPAKALRVD